MLFLPEQKLAYHAAQRYLSLNVADIRSAFARPIRPDNLAEVTRAPESR